MGQAVSGDQPFLANSLASGDPLFAFPEMIRRAMYTTNAIESLNSTLRKVTRAHKLFPSDEAVYKVLYLAVQSVTKHWTVPISNWKAALNWFALAFVERFIK